MRHHLTCDKIKPLCASRQVTAIRKGPRRAGARFKAGRWRTGLRRRDRPLFVGRQFCRLAPFGRTRTLLVARRRLLRGGWLARLLVPLARLEPGLALLAPEHRGIGRINPLFRPAVPHPRIHRHQRPVVNRAEVAQDLRDHPASAPAWPVSPARATASRRRGSGRGLLRLLHPYEATWILRKVPEREPRIRAAWSHASFRYSAHGTALSLR